LRSLAVRLSGLRSMALSAAAMGTLVFGTLHTNSAAKTIDRIIDIFPSDQQPQVRTMLAESLRGQRNRDEGGRHQPAALAPVG